MRVPKTAHFDNLCRLRQSDANNLSDDSRPCSAECYLVYRTIIVRIRTIWFWKKYCPKFGQSNRINKIEVFVLNKMAFVVVEPFTSSAARPVMCGVDHGERHDRLVLVFDERQVDVGNANGRGSHAVNLRCSQWSPPYRCQSMEADRTRVSRPGQPTNPARRSAPRTTRHITDARAEATRPVGVCAGCFRLLNPVVELATTPRQ